MEEKHVALALIDISGYTKFTVSTRTSVLHAQEIIFALLESLIEKSEDPLVLNKLEGDAVLMYADLRSGRRETAKRVLDQALACFAIFKEKAAACKRPRIVLLQRVHEHRRPSPEGHSSSGKCGVQEGPTIR